jgi:hypothetical protein
MLKAESKKEIKTEEIDPNVIKNMAEQLSAAGIKSNT